MGGLADVDSISRATVRSMSGFGGRNEIGGAADQYNTQIGLRFINQI